MAEFYVAKCNLGKVNLEAMLVSSFPAIVGENSSSGTLLQAESSGPSSPASAANSAPQTSSTVSAPVVAVGVHDLTLIVAIVDAVKASLAAEKGPGSSSSNLLGNSDSVEPQAAFGGVPAPSPSLSQQTATFLASGGAFPQQQAISSPTVTQFSHSSVMKQYYYLLTA